LDRMPEDLQCLYMDNDGHLKEGGRLIDDKKTRDKANRLGELMKKALKGTRFKLVAGFHIHRHTLNTMLAMTQNW